LAFFNIVKKKKEKKEKLIIKSELETYRMEYSTLSLLSSLRQLRIWFMTGRIVKLRHSHFHITSTTQSDFILMWKILIYLNY